MRKKLKIGKPFIEKVNSEIFGKAVRLCAEITMENPNSHKEETKVCYFEFEERFEKYLCAERSDAFVTGMISNAMENNMDIEFISPISERLYYGLSTYYIPMVSKNNPTYPMFNIKLNGPTDSIVIKNAKAVATGCSGGVDSFYTIARHSKGNTTKENELTHLVYSSTGSLDNSASRMKDTFIKTKKEIQKIAEECDLDAIYCYSNLNEFYLFPYKAFGTFFTPIYSSVAFALQKLIGIYYASSGDPVSAFNLNLSKIHGYDPSVFDVFSLSCLDSENLKFYSTGMECTRIEKEKYIADYKPAQKHLAVCSFYSLHEAQSNTAQNCCICFKCLRTICHFYSFGKLENFKDVFKVDEFIQQKTKFIGKMIGLEKKAYVTDFKKEAQKNNIKIPIMSYVYAYMWYKPIKILRKKFKHSLFARKIYYKFNLDYKLDGYRGPTYNAYKDKINNPNKK